MSQLQHTGRQPTRPHYLQPIEGSSVDTSFHFLERQQLCSRQAVAALATTVESAVKKQSSAKNKYNK